MPKLYEMRVQLEEVEPPVWRLILLPDDISLYDAGGVIIGAMGWNASHLFAFEIEGKRYDIAFEGGLDLDDSLDMDGVLARDVFRPGIKANFQYDFGDDWWHRIEILAHRAVEKGDKPPRCLGGERACPPDDSGGPYGYAEMLDAAADPDHPDHKVIKDWLGQFDPEAFDPKKADRNIRKVLQAFSK